MTNQSPKEWNVLVYQAGDNNLSGEMVWSLQEMAEVGARDEMHITAQFDPVGGPPKILKVNDPTAGFSPGKFPSLRKGMKDLDVDKITDFIDKKQPEKGGADARSSLALFESMKREFIPEEDTKAKEEREPPVSAAMIESSASPVMIEAFLWQHARKDCRNLLVLSGHGSGAVGDFLRDSNPFSTLTIKELAGLLGHIRDKIERKIDILGMDCCNMSMIEVCYEVRESVSLLVGSEGFLLNCGWPYRRILGQLKATPSTGAKAAAANIVKQYTDFYSDYTVAGVSVDMSAIDLSEEKMKALKDALAVLAAALLDGYGRLGEEEESARKDGAVEPKAPLDPALARAVLAGHWHAQSYKDEEYVDLWDFCDLLGKYRPDLFDTTKHVKDAIDDAVAISCFSGPMFQHSHGLSIYFPWKAPTEVVDDYCELEFSGKTGSGWGEFVKTYLWRTTREMRADIKTDPDVEAEHVPALDESLFLIRRNPPYSKRNPPYSKRNPPYSKGLFARPSEVKNFPDTFYPSVCECKKNETS